MSSVLFIFVSLFTGSISQVSINPGLSGAWYNASTDGQGMLVDVIPGRGQLFVAWFTFESASLKLGAPEQRWFTAQGHYAGNSAELTLFNSSGGRFNAPTPVATEVVGTAILTFHSCTEADFAFSFDEATSGEIPLTRLSPNVSCRPGGGNQSLPTTST